MVNDQTDILEFLSFVSWGFCLWGFCLSGLLSLGLLSLGAFVFGAFIHGASVRGAFVPGASVRAPLLCDRADSMNNKYQTDMNCIQSRYN